MKRYMILVLVLFVYSCSNKHKGDMNSLSYDSVQIVFTGGKKDFYKKGTLSLIFTEKKIVNKLNHLKNNSIRDYFTAHRPVMFEIDLFFIDSNTRKELQLTIVANTNGETIIQQGYYTQYTNQELYNYVSSLLKLDVIKKHKGSLSQEEYDTFR